MVVGDDVSVGRDNDTRSKSYAWLGLNLALASASVRISKEEIKDVHRLLNRLNLTQLGRFDVHYGIDGCFGSFGEVNSSSS